MATHPRTARLAPSNRALQPHAAPDLARGVVSRSALEEAAGVVRSRWRRVPRTLLAALLLLAVGTLGVYQVLQTSRIAEVGYELRTLERERSLVAAEVRLLEARSAQLARVAELEQRAAAELGMVEPARTLQVAIGVPAPATIPLPERFVPPAGELPQPPAPWWRQLLDRLPGGP